MTRADLAQQSEQLYDHTEGPKFESWRFKVYLVASMAYLTTVALVETPLALRGSLHKLRSRSVWIKAGTVIDTTVAGGAPSGVSDNLGSGSVAISDKVVTKYADSGIDAGHSFGQWW